MSWGRLEGEGAKAYAAFLVYCQIGARRSIDGAWRATNGQQTGNKRAPGRWTLWSREFNWQARAAEYDKEQAKKHLVYQVSENVSQIERYKEQNFDLSGKLYESAIKLISIINGRLTEATNADLRILSAALKAASQVAVTALASNAQTLGVNELLKEFNIGLTQDQKDELKDEL